jgi:hypothetical protein
MATRSVVTVTYQGEEYGGEYELAGRVVRVFFKGGSKTGILTGPDAELLARILLIDLVSRAPAKTAKPGKT